MDRATNIGGMFFLAFMILSVGGACVREYNNAKDIKCNFKCQDTMGISYGDLSDIPEDEDGLAIMRYFWIDNATKEVITEEIYNLYIECENNCKQNIEISKREYFEQLLASWGIDYFLNKSLEERNN